MNLALFRGALLEWFQAGARDLPWRRTQDPYRIWLSEVMLQQTRATAAIPYYERFLSLFPTLEALARASESEVLAAWSGLGYYSRARNLRNAATAMAGVFPSDYESIRNLPGVGDYTAAAVASIAFGLPHAVVDGNVLRVISRICNDSGDIAATATRKRFQATATRLLDVQNPGAFNQAMMELGATVCLPHVPLCPLCPVRVMCAARKAGSQDQLPVKQAKAAPEQLTLALALVEREGAILLQLRPETSRRMPNFWELPQLTDLHGVRQQKELGSFRHTIVNQCYTITVFLAKWSGHASGILCWLKPDRFAGVPVTTVTRKALRLHVKNLTE